MPGYAALVTAYETAEAESGGADTVVAATDRRHSDDERELVG